MGWVVGLDSFLGSDQTFPMPVKMGRYSRMGLARLSIFLVSALALTGSAAEPRVQKVLPFYLDAKGRQSLSPSLYDRDAYQAILRKNPTERSGLCFDVQWKAESPSSDALRIRIEVRGAQGQKLNVVTLEEKARPGGVFGNWTRLTLSGEEFKTLGEVVAWKATIWDGETQVAEHKSFLW